MLTEDSAEAEGVVPSDSQDGAEASQVGNRNINILLNMQEQLYK